MVEMMLPFYQGLYMRLHEHGGYYHGVSTNRVVTYKTEFSKTVAHYCLVLLGHPQFTTFYNYFLSIIWETHN